MYTRWSPHPQGLGVRAWTSVGQVLRLSPALSPRGGQCFLLRSRQLHSHCCVPGLLCVSHGSHLELGKYRRLSRADSYSWERVGYVLLSNKHSALRARKQAPVHLYPHPHTAQGLVHTPLPCCNGPDLHTEPPHGPCLNHLLGSLFLLKDISRDYDAHPTLQPLCRNKKKGSLVV